MDSAQISRRVRAWVRWTARTLMVALPWVAPAPAVAAESFPAGPVRIVVSFGAGGPMDTLARILAADLGPALGQPVVVENRVGATGNIGLDHVAKARPDGLVLGMMGSLAITAAINNPGRVVDPVRAFAPVARLVEQPLLIVVHPGVPAQTLAELVALARREPDRLAYSTQGIGTPPDVAALLLFQRAGITMRHIPYSGTGQTYKDVISGEVPMTISFVNLLKPFVQSGQLRAIAVTGAKRSPALPDVPTVAEAGFPGYEVGSWLGLVAPAGTPPDVVARLNAETLRIIDKPEVREKLRSLGMETAAMTPEQFAASIRDDYARWTPLLEAAMARTR